MGYLPDGKGGYVGGKRDPFITQETRDAAQETGRQHRVSTHAKCPTSKRVNALTGITYCWYCKGRIHTHYHYRGEPRLGCYTRQKGESCVQKSANLSVYEAQILSYLVNFHIPEDYQHQILNAQKELEQAYSDASAQKTSSRTS